MLGYLKDSEAGVHRDWRGCSVSRMSVQGRWMADRPSQPRGEAQCSRADTVLQGCVNAVVVRCRMVAG